MSSIDLKFPDQCGNNDNLLGKLDPTVKADSSVCSEEPCKQPRGDIHSDPNRGTDHHHVNDEPPSQVPIAIVGMAVRLPGGVRSTDSFWDLLLSQKDVSREVPQDRYNIDAFYSDTQSRAVKTRRGFFLDHDLADTDPSAFKMWGTEAGHMDPQQRLLLEVVWECMENAGQVDWRGKDIGCYVGNFGEDWLEMSMRDPLFTSRYHVFGASDFALSNRISYEYDLRGPSLTIRSACSASMSGLHVACQSVASKECSSAVVAGSSIFLTPTMTKCMSENMVLAPDGACKTFDRNADGFARGEAVNAVYIKRLDDAVRDGDPIRAVIRATMNTCDGQSSSLAIPSADAQESLIRKIYTRAGIADPTKTGLFECHGTGTSAGDLAETEAISRVFGEKGVHIGAVKPNVGHSEGASGLTSVIKGVLALEHRAIPPVARLKNRNPNVSLSLRIAKELTPWPEDRDERVSVNSFGIGGANSHVILESARSHLSRENGGSVGRRHMAPFLVPVSATSANSLARQIQHVKDYCKSRTVGAQDLAHTLGARRDHRRHRAFAVTTGEDIISELPAFESGVVSTKSLEQLVFVFTGQGAQWPGMGKELIPAFDGFRADIRRLDNVLQSLPDPPTWSMENTICAFDDASLFTQAEFAQPLCVAIQIGLVNLLGSWGIAPTLVVGHSSGEIAAAYAAHSITADAAITIAYYRGQAAKCHTRPGGMVAVGLGRDAVTQYLNDGVVVACENSPQSTVLSGDAEAVSQMIRFLNDEHPDILTTRLDVNTAYHSHHMAEIGHIFEQMIRGRAPACTPQIPMYSTVLGRSLTISDQLDSRYWRNNLELPVLFSTTIKKVLHDLQSQAMCFAEIGPHCPLSGPLRQMFKEAKIKPTPNYVATLCKNQHQSINIIQSVGRMFLNGIKVSFPALNGAGTVLFDLPPYPWDYSTKQWMESRVTKGWRMRQHGHHELLGSRVLESNDLEPSWRNILRLEDSPWLADHKFSGCIVYPSAGHIAAVGEAIRQVSGASRYVIRNMFIKNALVLDAQDDVELMTSLRPVTLTDVLDSDWYQFVIHSYNGTEWRKHCTGHVTAVHDAVPAGEPAPPFLRHVDTGLQYRSLRELGLDYGPHFQGLDGVTADPISETARGRITIQEPLEQIDTYSVHPTVIDKALQLMTVAGTRGIARHMDRVAIPVSFDKVYCGCGNPGELRAQATCRKAAHGNFMADSLVVGSTEVILDIQGVKSFAMEADDHGNSFNDGLRSARTDWQPDIEFVPSLADLLPPAPPRMELELHVIEQICALQIMIMYRSTQNITPKASYLLNYKHWLAQCVEKFQHGNHALVPEAQEWTAMDPEQQESLRASLSRRAEENFQSESAQMIARFSSRIAASVEGIFRGEVSMVESMMVNNDLELFYNSISHPSDYRPFLSALGRSRPHMRVLEIGAGTGGMTASTLEGLETANGVRMFSEYVFTDISPGFFSAGRERFRNIPRMVFKTLDITRDPVEQGFSAASFDLVVCSNVLHATPALQTTLSNVRKLLVPGGYLFLQELCPETSLIDGIMGLLEGWWVGECEGRVDHPYISPSRWDEELRMAGFTGAEAMAYDNVQPYQFNANIISRLPSDELTGEHISLLYDGAITESARSIENVFLRQGYSVSWCTLESGACGNIVSLLDLNSPFFDGISQRSFDLFRDFINREPPKSILWVARHIQMECEDPRWSQTFAVARSVRLESSIPFATVEMDPPNQRGLDLLVKVYQKFQSRLLSGLEPDYEYSIKRGSVYTCRYHPTDLSERATTRRCPNGARRLSIGSTGLLDTLHWVQHEPRLPGAGEVEIEVRYVALNFKDMMVAMGFIGHKDDLGFEASGIVRGIGPGPHDQILRVGDRVSVMGSPMFSTSVVAKSIQCCKIPAKLSLEKAVTLPCVYATVVYSLLTVGRLQSGQSVLVHSACGGVGLAAIQVCQMIGAEIFATVGSEVKAQHLVNNHHIPRDRIFNSRNPSFKEDVLGVTGGRGVDIVLNSLSGECLHASWECVAEFGTMVEIGKRDMMGHGTLRMDQFQGNRSFFGVDLHHMGLQRPAEVFRIWQQAIGYIERGQIKPIEPRTIFEAHEVEDAFRYMQTGEHMGKILVRFPEDPVQLPVSTAEERLSLSPEVSYLLVGGLGGLGQAVSRWMVESGARSLVFLSRSAGHSAGFEAFHHELKVMGCSITAVAGDVANPDDVKRALNACPHPVAGVIQMAMVLKDQTFEKMTHDEWTGAISPKIEGTWNLYRALQDHPLDFFVLFGSLVGHLANVGQANYGAANCFHEAFAKYSRARGFPSAVLDLGAVKDIGYVSAHPDLLQRCLASSIEPLGERQLVRAMQVAIAQARVPFNPDQGADLSSVIVGLQQLTNEHCRTTYQSDLRLALFKEADTQHESGGSSQMDTINQFIADAERDPSILHLPSSVELMTLEIAHLVRAGSGDESVEAAAEIPIDSLMTIEIRSWLRKRLNVDVPAMKIAKGKNIGGLSKFVLEGIDEKLRLKGVGTGQVASE